MMVEQGQITNVELPVSQNFSALKNIGLDYIQSLSSQYWSNFNESDPGITILDQLCYALTELGYCNDFPIQDVLTNENGEIDFSQQFFFPQDILTTNPITNEDYHRLIIDSKLPVKNIYFHQGTNLGSYGVLQVFLYLDENLSRSQHQEIRQAVDILLNKHRNLCQVFSTPKVLKPKEIEIEGDVFLHDKVSTQQVISEIKLAIEQYISPEFKQYGYQELAEEGYSEQEIFSGPELDNGWIPDCELNVDKRTQIRADEISALITNVKGVKKVSSLTMLTALEKSTGRNTQKVHIRLHQIASLKLSVDNFTIHQYDQKSKISTHPTLHFDLKKLQQQHQSAKIGTTVDIAPSLPEGRFRNIGEYYSVQNTFPSFYGIGFDSIQSDTPNFRVAQSRQLRGYLMVFDQLLANQFSQLEQVSQLFSFSEKQTAITAPDKSYSKIPYQLFAPTYFSQPLYDVPNVRPLLLGSSVYQFEFSKTSKQQEIDNSWKRYQEDPFNLYANGLRNQMENDSERDDRRNRMLNHLLARHGENAEQIDQLVTSSRWYGSLQKTRIIIKSLYLQNYQLISYNRSRAYSFQMAAKIGTPGRYRIAPSSLSNVSQVLELDNQGDSVSDKKLSAIVNVGFSSKKDIFDALTNLTTTKITDQQKDLINKDIEDSNQLQKYQGATALSDGQVNIRNIENAEKIHEKNFDNYSMFEMISNLLLGLKQTYDFLIGILITLIENSEFVQWVTQKKKHKPFKFTDEHLHLVVKRDGNCNKILLGREPVLTICPGENGMIDTALYQAHIDQLVWLSSQRMGFIFQENILLLKSASNYTKQIKVNASDFFFKTLAIFPNYIHRFQQDQFRQKLNDLVDSYFPAQVSNSLCRLTFKELEQIIPDFINWQNSLHYSHQGNLDLTAKSIENLVRNLLNKEDFSL